MSKIPGFRRLPMMPNIFTTIIRVPKIKLIQRTCERALLMFIPVTD